MVFLFAGFLCALATFRTIVESSLVIQNDAEKNIPLAYIAEFLERLRFHANACAHPNEHAVPTFADCDAAAFERVFCDEQHPDAFGGR